MTVFFFDSLEPAFTRASPTKAQTIATIKTSKRVENIYPYFLSGK